MGFSSSLYWKRFAARFFATRALTRSAISAFLGSTPSVEDSGIASAGGVGAMVIEVRCPLWIFRARQNLRIPCQLQGFPMSVQKWLVLMELNNIIEQFALRK